MSNGAGEAFTGLASVPKDTRPIYEYTVPAELQGSGASKVTTLGIVELTPDEELMATRRCGGDPIGLAYELAKQALVEVNGQPVTIGDGTADLWVAKMCPKLRAMMVTEYTDINTPTQKDVDSFRKGRRIKSR